MNTQAEEAALILDARGVSKRFGAVLALRDAALKLHRGEVVALMGANGAGKSTFVKILTGALKRDTGEVEISGENRSIGSPAAARRAGLVPVYQEPSLIPDLSVADNLRLGDTPVADFVHWTRELGIPDLDLSLHTHELPLATLRILDLARALASKPDILLLDEMTAALPADLVERVLKVVRKHADEGMAVIYVSHRFTEIAQLCDRATVLRDGKTVGDLPIEAGVEEHIVELMLGAALKPTTRAQAAQHEQTSSKVPRLNVHGIAAGTRLTDVSFEMFPGEVLGVVALEGQGQDELFNVLAGFQKPKAGTLEVDGKNMSFDHPAAAIAAGINLVPGDRVSALLMSRSVQENIALPRVAALKNWGIVALKREAEKVNAAIARLQIDTRAQGEVRRLSGGNQQKVTIARWIARGVETLLLFDPTRGIDVRTKQQIYTLVRELADQGAAILFYTSELAEIRMACDRAVVIFNGRVVDIIDAKDADDQTLMRAAYGLTAQGAA
ncbi:sugar ABC transporter ATP-binding protein [Aestuariivirga litoralis]|uniref:sugar ABC transporter ATP-binding protein n=1 Tax=Aestuariivirga litoralis TaxID=2650924 RepID=UPI0018C52036|nr:sugar ABC transporter ATP-binding protein [Aestuariivirga litoralis]MBG1232349.1 sugar ABC transporter ATP-binding protein [Aestuariivirga litoralis]